MCQSSCIGSIVQWICIHYQNILNFKNLEVYSSLAFSEFSEKEGVAFILEMLREVFSIITKISS